MLKTRRDWISEINAMHGEMDRWMDYVSGRKPPSGLFAPAGWAPAIDVYETPDEVVVLGGLAGIKREEIDITAEGNHLVLSGERKDLGPGKSRRYHQMEIQWGHFERTVMLPAAVDPDKAQASYADGILEIVLPRSPESKTQRVRLKKT